MNESQPGQPAESVAQPAKRPYRTPRLHVFGPVTAITHSFNMMGKLRDGGPSNLKSL